jgi:hypothetical protein
MSIDISAPEETPLPFGFNIMGIVAKGNVNGNLNLSLENSVFTVSGDLTAQDTEITLNMDELNTVSIAAQPQLTITTVVKLTIHAGPKLEFFWPSDAFPIIQAYADLGSTIAIESDSSSGRFLLIGDVPLRSGEIFYFERSFYLQEGILSFNENEVDVDPHISARAEVRDRTDDGPVTISLIVDDAPLSSFTARFESNPPLSQVAIFSLLGQTLTGVQTGSGNSNPFYFLSSSADILAQTQVVRRVERQLRNWLHLDMFSVRTQVLQNLILQSSIFQGQAETVAADGGTSAETNATIDKDRRERGSTVGNYFDNTTVFIGKYVGRDMFIQAMLSLRYDEKNQKWGGLAFEPDFGIELRNPLFAIRWNFTPVHLENLFVDDISFTLTWRKTF